MAKALLRRIHAGRLSPLELEMLCRRNPPADEKTWEFCLEVFARVERQGDEALRELTRKLDGVDLEELAVSEEEWLEGERAVSEEVRSALETACRNIRLFHSQDQSASRPLEIQPGVFCWWESRALPSVGLYVPGGRAVLPSSMLMLGVPASLAGCRQIVACVPPGRDGHLSPEVLLAARLAGVHALFKIGGAQAIAALALGTSTVPRVDKILGPGNRWVQTAKLVAFSRGTAIDLIAGPSEVMVIADDAANPRWLAADLLAQAEHDPDSRALLVSPAQELITRVRREVTRQLRGLQRSDVARQALEKSFILQTERLEDAFSFANQYAPEHLILHLEDPVRWLEQVECVGALFLGAWSPEVAGDYASGPNHTLPTGRLARALSGLSLRSFQRRFAVQQLTPQGLGSLAPTLRQLARVEGLQAHELAVAVRFEQGVVRG